MDILQLHGGSNADKHLDVAVLLVDEGVEALALDLVELNLPAHQHVSMSSASTGCLEGATHDERLGAHLAEQRLGGLAVGAVALAEDGDRVVLDDLLGFGFGGHDGVW